MADIRPDALDRLGLTARESEVLRAAAVFEGEAELAWELFLSLHAVSERLARLEAKLEVRTAGEAALARVPAETVPRSPRCSGRPAGRSIEAEVLEGRPPKTLDAPRREHVSLLPRRLGPADDPRCTRSLSRLAPVTAPARRARSAIRCPGARAGRRDRGRCDHASTSVRMRWSVPAGAVASALARRCATALGSSRPAPAGPRSAGRGRCGSGARATASLTSSDSQPVSATSRREEHRIPSRVGGRRKRGAPRGRPP